MENTEVINITKNQLRLRKVIRSKLNMLDEPWAEIVNLFSYYDSYYDKDFCVCGHCIHEIYEIRYNKYIFLIGRDCINNFIENGELYDKLMKSYLTINKCHSKKLTCGKHKGKKYKEAFKDDKYINTLLFIRREEGEVYSRLVEFLDYCIYHRRKNASI